LFAPVLGFQVPWLLAGLTTSLQQERGTRQLLDSTITAALTTEGKEASEAVSAQIKVPPPARATRPSSALSMRLAFYAAVRGAGGGADSSRPCGGHGACRIPLRGTGAQTRLSLLGRDRRPTQPPRLAMPSMPSARNDRVPAAPSGMGMP
jgi:hypothetical protein